MLVQASFIQSNLRQKAAAPLCFCFSRGVPSRWHACMIQHLPPGPIMATVYGRTILYLRAPQSGLARPIYTVANRSSYISRPGTSSAGVKQPRARCLSSGVSCLHCMGVIVKVTPAPAVRWNTRAAASSASAASRCFFFAIA